MLKITHFPGVSENAVRIQIAVVLIAFLLLRLAQQMKSAVESPLTSASLIRANLMHLRGFNELLELPKQANPLLHVQSPCRAAVGQARP